MVWDGSSSDDDPTRRELRNFVLWPWGEMAALPPVDVIKQTRGLRSTSSQTTTLDSSARHFLDFHLIFLRSTGVGTIQKPCWQPSHYYEGSQPENKANRHKGRAQRITKKWSQSPDQSVPETYPTSSPFGYVNHSTAPINYPVWTRFSVPYNSKHPNWHILMHGWMNHRARDYAETSSLFWRLNSDFKFPGSKSPHWTWSASIPGLREFLDTGPQ